ncbi:MAG: hypothetical protein M0020_07325, partial [Actinomycetota bacterium]|nr:hypothetical protein [Actinomycetota bacterium]
MDIPADAIAHYPGAGTLRVHPDPAWLAPPDPENPGPNRFDDPEGHTAVRYTAERLIACLLETLSRFRALPRAEKRLAEMHGIDPDDIEHMPEDPEPIAAWLAEQRVGTVHVLDVGDFVELECRRSRYPAPRSSSYPPPGSCGHVYSTTPPFARWSGPM